MEGKATPPDQLTDREHQILERLSRGLSDQQIAADLFLSPNTVKWYNRQIYSKLGVDNRTQAILRANDLGLLHGGLSSPSPVSKHNLPLQPTLFIGRTREVAELKGLLQRSRLLTLTGVGGSGKTRLALRLAADVLNDYADGVYFIDLAPVSHPALVAKTIAAALDVREDPNEPVLESLGRALTGQSALLLIDNFEHLISAAPVVSALLAASADLKVVVTSREALRLSGEQEYAVPPLSLPPTTVLSLHDVSESEAVALFVQRAQLVQPHFVLNATNAPAIAQICQRMDGLPLAIELAAARCKLLPPPALLTRLGCRLSALASGPRDAPARQRTLRATLEWSYHLLDADEKVLFARLAVFQGGSSLDAIEAVCGDDRSIDVLDALASLVDKSLVQQKETAEGEPRFMLLETIHEYTWDRLHASGEAQLMRQRHARFFVDLAERAEPELRLAPHERWLRRFELERDNIDAVFEWSLGEGSVELGIRLVSALWLFWYAYGYHANGQRCTQQLLPHLHQIPEDQHARFLIAAGNMIMTSDRAAAKPLFLKALEISQQRGDRLDTAWSLAFVATISAREPNSMAMAQEALSMMRALNHQPGIAYALNVVGEIARTSGDDVTARRAYKECLDVCLRTGETRRVAIMYFNLAFLAQHEGDYAGALALTRHALMIARDMNNRGELAWGLPIAAGCMAALGQPQRAARLLGTSQTFLERLGAFIMPADKQEFDRIRAEVSVQLGEAAFLAAWVEGQQMTLAQAVEQVLVDEN